MTWEKGRQLKSFDSNTYTYNANGIRTSKTVDGIRHDYVLDGTKILREEWNGNTLVPIYDNEDSVCGICFNGEYFYFQKNLQGDIIAIVDDKADVVAQYSYDAWGVCTIVSDTSACSIATINPYRYRGYYYDNEIGMYYLQTRYYDSSISRFVTLDDPAIISSTANTDSMATNKFCYCLNSPINGTDENGTIANFIVQMISNFIWGFVGGVLGLYLANVTLNIFYKKKKFYEKNDSWGTYIGEGVKAGAFAIFGNKIVYKIIAVVGASLLKQFIDMIVYRKSFNFWGLVADIIVGVLFVIVIHFAPTVIKKLPKSQKSSSNKWIAKLKEVIRTLANNAISKLRNAIDRLIAFFKNTFVKRFSISYAKRIASELKKIFK